jgi:hypothetical protein
MPLAGEIIRASDVNSPACRVTRTAVQSIPDNTVTAVAFTSERFDNDAMHNNVTNNTRITFTSAGIYVVGFHGMFAGAADYSRVFCIIRLNGATELCRSSPAVAGVSTTPQIDVSTMSNFAAGDYVEALVFHDNTANVARDLEATDQRSPDFYAARIGELA